MFIVTFIVHLSYHRIIVIRPMRYRSPYANIGRAFSPF